VALIGPGAGGNFGAPCRSWITSCAICAAPVFALRRHAGSAARVASSRGPAERGRDAGDRSARLRCLALAGIGAHAPPENVIGNTPGNDCIILSNCRPCAAGKTCSRVPLYLNIGCLGAKNGSNCPGREYKNKTLFWKKILF
jgi:hypothetical protein